MLMDADADPLAARLLQLALLAGLAVLVPWGAGAGQLWWPGLVAIAGVAGLCLRAWKAAVVVAVGLACACAVDGSLAKTGHVRYAGGDPSLPLPPAWVFAAWTLPAAAIALPVRALLASPVLAGILGAIAGPLAYHGARSLGALEIRGPGLVLIGVYCALALPVIVLAANRLLPPPAPALPAPRRPPPRPRPPA